jgi:hypothetical protein
MKFKGINEQMKFQKSHKNSHINSRHVKTNNKGNGLKQAFNNANLRESNALEISKEEYLKLVQRSAGKDVTYFSSIQNKEGYK